MKIDLSKYLNPTDAAARRGISRDMLYDAMRDGRLDYVEMPGGKGRLIAIEDIDKLPVNENLQRAGAGKKWKQKKGGKKS